MKKLIIFLLLLPKFIINSEVQNNIQDQNNNFFALYIQFLLQQKKPFTSNPELTWQQFETNFRQTYNHLNIPPILSTLPHCVSTENTIKTSPSYNSNKKSIFLCSATPLTPEETEFILLHEIGHHYQNNDTQQLKDKSEETKQACLKNLKHLRSILLTTQIISNTILLKKALTQKTDTPNKTLLYALLNQTTMIGLGYKLLDPYFILHPYHTGKSQLPLEKDADNFASKHASLQTLQAAYTFFETEKYVTFHYNADKAHITHLIKQQQEKKESSFFLKAKLLFYTSLSKAPKLYETWINLWNFSHPSNKERQATILREIKKAQT